MENQRCFCGSSLFYVQVNTFSPSKHHIYLVCSGCKCERTISSPGYSADYEVSPQFIKDVT